MTAPSRTPARSGVVVVGTGFGCITHVRALRAAGFDVLGARRARSRPHARARPPVRRSAARSPRSTTRSRSTVSTRSRSPLPRTRTPSSRSRAIAAGKHVICEKPFARDAAEGRRVLAAARRRRDRAPARHRVPLGSRARRRSPAPSGRARSASRASRRCCCTSRCSPTPRPRCPTWWADDASGGGWFGAHGSQVIDQLRVTLGEFAGVSASLPHVAASTRDRRRRASSCTSRRASRLRGRDAEHRGRLGTAGRDHARRGHARHRVDRRHRREGARSPTATAPAPCRSAPTCRPVRPSRCRRACCTRRTTA